MTTLILGIRDVHQLDTRLLHHRQLWYYPRIVPEHLSTQATVQDVQKVWRGKHMIARVAAQSKMWTKQHMSPQIGVLLVQECGAGNISKQMR